MYGNIRKSNISGTKGLVPIEAVQEIVQQITNPIKQEKPLEADGGAFRSYCYNVYKNKK